MFLKEFDLLIMSDLCTVSNIRRQTHKRYPANGIETEEMFCIFFSIRKEMFVQLFKIDN